MTGRYMRCASSSLVAWYTDVQISICIHRDDYIRYPRYVASPISTESFFFWIQRFLWRWSGVDVVHRCLMVWLETSRPLRISTHKLDLVCRSFLIMSDFYCRRHIVAVFRSHVRTQESWRQIVNHVLHVSHEIYHPGVVSLVSAVDALALDVSPFVR